MVTPAIRHGAYSAPSRAAMRPWAIPPPLRPSPHGPPSGVCASPPDPVGSIRFRALVRRPSRMRACGDPRARFAFYPTRNRKSEMTRRKKIYEGKAKILYEGPEPGTLIQYFKDDATAFNASK